MLNIISHDEISRIKLIAFVGGVVQLAVMTLSWGFVRTFCGSCGLPVGGDCRYGEHVKPTFD